MGIVLIQFNIFNTVLLLFLVGLEIVKSEMILREFLKKTVLCIKVCFRDIQLKLKMNANF